MTVAVEKFGGPVDDWVRDRAAQLIKYKVYLTYLLEGKDARAQILCDAFGHGAIENPFGLIHGEERARTPGITQPLQRHFFQRVFVEQSAADISVVVSAIESLLKSPIELLLWSGAGFEVPRQLQMGFDE